MFLVEMIYLWEKVIKQIKDAFGPIKRINNIDLCHKFYVLSTLYSIVKAASIWSMLRTAVRSLSQVTWCRLVCNDYNVISKQSFGDCCLKF